MEQIDCHGPSDFQYFSLRFQMLVFQQHGHSRLASMRNLSRRRRFSHPEFRCEI
jgi:hypothetical protein